MTRNAEAMGLEIPFRARTNVTAYLLEIEAIENAQQEV